MVPPSVRRLAAAGFAVLLVLAVAAPVLGYNEENVKHIRLRRLDPISCTQTFRVQARLTDRDGDPVPGAEVRFRFVQKKQGDTLAPTVVFSNTQGRATTVVDLSCREGQRKIRARVPGDGRATITFNCRPRHGCTIGGGGGNTNNDSLIAPIGRSGIGPVESIAVPTVDPVQNALGSLAPSMPAPSPILNLLGLITMAAIAADLVRQRRPARRNTFGLAPG